MLLGRTVAVRKWTAVGIAIVTSSMTFLCLYISRWWRQTWDMAPYFTVVNQSKARISTEHRIRGYISFYRNMYVIYVLHLFHTGRTLYIHILFYSLTCLSRWCQALSCFYLICVHIFYPCCCFTMIVLLACYLLSDNSSRSECYLLIVTDVE